MEVKVVIDCAAFDLRTVLNARAFNVVKMKAVGAVSGLSADAFAESGVPSEARAAR